MVDSRLKAGDLFIRYSKYDDERYIGVVKEQTEETCINNGLIVRETVVVPHSSNDNRVSYSNVDSDNYHLKKIDELVGWTITMDELKQIVLDNGQMMKLSTLINLYAKPLEFIIKELIKNNAKKFGC